MKNMTLKRLLREKTSCTIQHTGWCCSTCFFNISKNLDNKDWQTLLWFGGDYKESDLDNLPRPEEREAILEKIADLCRQKV